MVAVLSAWVSYGSMNLSMVSTPLAMVACAHPFATAAFVIQGHIVGMYAPSFVTATIIHRVGALPVIAVGGMLILACVAVHQTGVAGLQSLGALLLLGVDWNFMFVGAPTLLPKIYQIGTTAK